MKQMKVDKKTAEPETGATDFWEGKKPCWEATACPASIYKTCPAYLHRSYPCWEIEGTYCKWNHWGSQGSDTSTCSICKVFRYNGEGRSIELKLYGHGIKLLKAFDRA